MSFQVLSERLAALQESNNRLRELINRLETTKFQPGSIPIDSEEGNPIFELSTEIQQTIKEQDEDFELLREEASGLDPGKPSSELDEQKARLEEVIRRGISELRKCQKDFRHAQIVARKNCEEAQRTEREILLQSYSSTRPSISSPVPGPRRKAGQAPKELSQDEKVVNASSDITLALRQTHALMSSELSRSQFAHDTLKDSSAALARLEENYSRLDSFLSSSKSLLSILITSNKSDTWYLETAFWILALTIGWLVFRRLLYGPTWLLIWLPLKIVYRTFLGLLAVTGIKGGKNVSFQLEGPLSSISEAISASHSIGSGSSVTMSASDAPSIVVGSGSNEAPIGTDKTVDQSGEGDSVSEQVGRIVDGDGAEDAWGSDEKNVPDDTQDEDHSQRNPKKRMWEENVEESQRKKDEL